MEGPLPQTVPPCCVIGLLRGAQSFLCNNLDILELVQQTIVRIENETQTGEMTPEEKSQWMMFNSRP